MSFKWPECAGCVSASSQDPCLIEAAAVVRTRLHMCAMAFSWLTGKEGQAGATCDH